MRLTSLALALLSAGAIYYWFAVRGPARDAAVTVVTAATTGAAAEASPPVAVMVQQSEARRMVDQLVVRGRTVAIRNVSVPAETAGLVISPPLRKGATVKQAEVLSRPHPGPVTGPGRGWGDS